MLDYPKMPTADGTNDARNEVEEEFADRLKIEIAECQCCGIVRQRLFVDKARRSGWGYCESISEMLLGRPLSDEDQRRTLRGIVLN